MIRGFAPLSGPFATDRFLTKLSAYAPTFAKRNPFTREHFKHGKFHTEGRLYVDRIARGHRHHSHSRRDAVARSGESQRQGPTDLLPEQHEAVDAGDASVRG